MGQRSISEIMREGQEKTLEQVALLEKQMNGTITEDEKLRLGMLNGNLLALMKEAQAQGVGVGVGTGYGEVDTDEANENDYWNEDDSYDDGELGDLSEEEEDGEDTGFFRFY